MQLQRLPVRLSQQVDRVRDRTAEAMGSDSGSTLREISRLGTKLDGMERSLADHLEAIAAMTRETESHVDDLETATSRTTWPRRIFWMVVGMGAGAAAAYLNDPDRGDQRRNELRGQAQQRMQTVSSDVSERAKTVKERAAERAQDVKAQAAASKRSVTDETQRAVQDVKGEAQQAIVDVRDEAEQATEDVKREVSSDTSPAGRPSTAPPPSRSI